jgi:hypothetical protein
MSTHRDGECAPPQPPAEFRRQYALNKDFAARLVPHLREVCGDAFRVPNGHACAGLNCFDNPPVAVCKERRCVVGREDSGLGLQAASPELTVAVDPGWTLDCEGCAHEFNRYLRRRARTMHRCWEQSHRKQPRPSAVVTLQARLEPTGLLSAPTVVVDDVEPSFGRCLVAAVRRFRLSTEALEVDEDGAELKGLTIRGAVAE